MFSIVCFSSYFAVSSEFRSQASASCRLCVEHPLHVCQASEGEGEPGKKKLFIFIGALGDGRPSGQNDNDHSFMSGIFLPYL